MKISKKIAAFIRTTKEQGEHDKKAIEHLIERLDREIKNPDALFRATYKRLSWSFDTSWLIVLSEVTVKEKLTLSALFATASDPHTKTSDEQLGNQYTYRSTHSRR